MKIAITSQGQDANSPVDPRFGRCKYFLIFETDSDGFEIIENPNLQSSGGAGIQAGQLMLSKGVKMVLTGNVGPNASQVLTPAGIKIQTGVSGTVAEALQHFKAGKFNTNASST